MEVVAKASDVDRHKEDLESVIVVQDKVITAADDGKVKIWNKSDLTLIKQFKAHEYAVMHLLAFNECLYTASMDQTIKVWNMESWALVNTLEGHEDSPKRLGTDGKHIYSGDDKGEVFIWDKDGKLLERIEVVEEVWDLYVQGNRIYTIRDRGLTITETREGSKKHSAICILEGGRAPFHITEKDIFLCERSGRTIDHFSNTPPKCEYQQEFKGFHEKIITVLGGYKDFLVSGGWDEALVIWSVDQGSNLGSVKLPGCPSALAVSEEDKTMFVGGADGFLVKININI